MKKWQLFLLLLVSAIFLFPACKTPNYSIVSKPNFKKDLIKKEDVKSLQYYFIADRPLVLKRVHLKRRTIEDGVVYRLVSDSTFTIAPYTEGVLRYVYRDQQAQLDYFYEGFKVGMPAIPFHPTGDESRFKLFIESRITTTSGRSLPLVVIRNEDGEIKEAWAVWDYDPKNLLAYDARKKVKRVVIDADGETIGGKKKKGKDDDGY
ncbi:MAG: hypothetical protein AAB438_03675 [Patescibacteria group bacterium]